LICCFGVRAIRSGRDIRRFAAAAQDGPGDGSNFIKELEKAAAVAHAAVKPVLTQEHRSLIHLTDAKQLAHGLNMKCSDQEKRDEDG
jgi:hypothetical protein